MSANILPYVILDDSGSVAAVLQTNEKGYKKSIENSRLWVLNQETGRLLPEDGLGVPRTFREGEGWYEAVIPGSDKNREAEKAADCGQAAGAETGSTGRSEIIERLFGVIEQRKKELPEGSYTTHLFNSGMSKIKKKTGEEAVELLLAENRDEMIYEAADLIYHMLVMLAQAGINPSEIFSELESRE